MYNNAIAAYLEAFDNNWNVKREILTLEAYSESRRWTAAFTNGVRWEMERRGIL